MSKQAKIIIFSIILFASFLMKHCNDDGLPYKKPVTEKKNDWDPNDLGDSETETNDDYIKPIDISTPPEKVISDKDIIDLRKKLEEFEPKFKKIDFISATPRPENGYSPYNSYFGSGIYNNSAQNNVVVTAPEKADMVIFIRDVYSGKTIRNEYIRANSTFSLTGIPYGNYKFLYLYGRTWDANTDFKNGAAKGNFMNDRGVGKSDDSIDFEFKTGYTGTYTLKLQLIQNGNLETVPASEDEI